MTCCSFVFSNSFSFSFNFSLTFCFSFRQCTEQVCFCLMFYCFKRFRFYYFTFSLLKYYCTARCRKPRTGHSMKTLNFLELDSQSQTSKAPRSVCIKGITAMSIFTIPVIYVQGGYFVSRCILKGFAINSLPQCKIMQRAYIHGLPFLEVNI